MSDLVDKVGRAICCGDEQCAAEAMGDAFPNLTCPCHAAQHRNARAAISAVLEDMMEPSEEMMRAYGRAIKDYIESTPEGKLTWRKFKKGRGYWIPTRRKATARFHAMIAAYAKANGIEIGREKA